MSDSKNVLKIVQAEVGKWTDQFGNNSSHDPQYKGSELHSLPSLLGMCEEIGELQGAVCKRHQGRGFTIDKEFRGEIMDCLGDILLFMSDYANREGIDLSSNLERVWDKVSKRRKSSWTDDKSKESSNTHLAEEGVEEEPSIDPSEFETEHPSEHLITIALKNYGWCLSDKHGSKMLIHPSHKAKAAKWMNARYRGEGIVYPNWFKPILKQMIKNRCEQTGQGWAEPPEEVEEKVSTRNLKKHKVPDSIIEDKNVGPITLEYSCDHEDPDRSGFCIKCQKPWEEWELDEPPEEVEEKNVVQIRLGELFNIPEIFGTNSVVRLKSIEPGPMQFDSQNEVELSVTLIGYVETLPTESSEEDRQDAPKTTISKIQYLLQTGNWYSSEERKQLYQSIAAIGLQYGDDNLLSIEEGLLKRLIVVAEDAEARLHGRDAKEIRDKLNEIRKLRPSILGEPKTPLK